MQLFAGHAVAVAVAVRVRARERGPPSGRSIAVAVAVLRAGCTAEISRADRDPPGSTVTVLALDPSPTDEDSGKGSRGVTDPLLCVRHACWLAENGTRPVSPGRILGMALAWNCHRVVPYRY